MVEKVKQWPQIQRAKKPPTVLDKVKRIERSLKLLQLLEVPAYGGACIMMALFFCLIGWNYEMSNLSPIWVIVVLAIVALCDVIPATLAESRVQSQLYLKQEDWSNRRYTSATILLAPLLIVALVGRIFGGRALWVLGLYMAFLSLAYVVHLVTALRLLYLLRKQNLSIETEKG